MTSLIGSEAQQADSATLLEISELKKYFRVESGMIEQMISTNYVKAVDGVNLSIGPNETVALVGESGCGKTTLGRTMARLYQPTAGTITFQGEDITEIEGDELKHLRKKIQVVFQNPMSSLNPQKSVRDIVATPLRVHGLVEEGSVVQRVVELLDDVGLQETHLDRFPHELSGGQRQRIGIARALAVEPDLIVADEPVSALDASIQAQILNLLNDLQTQYGLSYLFIAHDLSVVKYISDRTVVMYLGKIMEEGPTEEVFNNPHHPYTRALLQSIPRLDGQAERRNLLQGDPPSPVDIPSGCRFRNRCPEFIGEQCVEQEPMLEPVRDTELEVNIGNEHGIPQSACHWLHEPSNKRKDYQLE